jgi:hypothetical protein
MKYGQGKSCAGRLDFSTHGNGGLTQREVELIVWGELVATLQTTATMIELLPDHEADLLEACVDLVRAIYCTSTLHADRCAGMIDEVLKCIGTHTSSIAAAIVGRIRRAIENP